MDINKLIHFRAVAETGNLRKAAEILAISPGALSKSIRVFQEELETKLIEPHGRGIVLSKKGKELYQNSHRIMAEINDLRAKLHRPVPDLHRIGTYEVFSGRFLANFIAKEMVENVQCLELGPGEIEEALLEGKIDYGLTFAPFPHEDLDHLPISKINMKTYCKRGGKFESSEQEELEYAVPVTALGPNPLKSEAIDHWPSNLSRKINYRFQMLETALQICARDLSVIYCPDMVINLFNQGLLKKNELVEHAQQRKTQKLKVYLVKKKEHEEDKFCRKLSKFARSL